MTHNAIALTAGALGCLGALLIGFGTGSLVAMIGAFCVVAGGLLPWYNVREVSVQYGETHARRDIDP